MNLPGVDTQYILQDCYLLHSESWGGQSELVWGRHTVYITGLLLITFYHHSKDALGTTGWWWDGGACEEEWLREGLLQSLRYSRD